MPSCSWLPTHAAQGRVSYKAHPSYSDSEDSLVHAQHLQQQGAQERKDAAQSQQPPPPPQYQPQLEDTLARSEAELREAADRLHTLQEQEAARPMRLALQVKAFEA